MHWTWKIKSLFLSLNFHFWAFQAFKVSLKSFDFNTLMSLSHYFFSSFNNASFFTRWRKRTTNLLKITMNTNKVFHCQFDKFNVKFSFFRLEKAFLFFQHFFSFLLLIVDTKKPVKHGFFAHSTSSKCFFMLFQTT